MQKSIFFCEIRHLGRVREGDFDETFAALKALGIDGFQFSTRDIEKVGEECLRAALARHRLHADIIHTVVPLLSADDAGMKLNMELRGKWTEESSYSARFKSESVGAEIINKTPIAIGDSYYGGVISYDFYEKQSKIMCCDMTLRPGSTPVYSIHM